MKKIKSEQIWEKREEGGGKGKYWDSEYIPVVNRNLSHSYYKTQSEYVCENRASLL